MSELVPEVERVLALPREAQVDALRELLARLPVRPAPEAWNTAFGPRSLFAAWTSTSIARGLYDRNAELLRPVLDARPGFRLVEVGGGDGSLWRRVLRPGDRGELVVIDPVPEAHERVAEALPPGVALRSVVAPVEQAELPEADVIVCALTLHHLAGRDAAERAAAGLAGPGKREVLASFGEALRAREGLGVLVEADVHCEVDLPPGDPVLRDNLLDSYVRRCGRAILDDLRTREVDADLRARWEAMLRHWFLEQVQQADVPLADRDVYELTVDRWLDVLDRAGLEVTDHRFVDAYRLFHRYVFRPR